MSRPVPDFIENPRVATTSNLHMRPVVPEPTGKGGKRQGKRKVSVAPVGPVIEGTRVVPDPYEAGAVLVARVNLAEHPLELMLARGRLTRGQYDAGVIVRGLYERAEIGGVRGIDPGSIKVDGGRMADPLSDAVQQAHRRLSEVAGALGMIGYRVVSAVCGHGLTVSALAGMWPGRETVRAKTDYLDIRLREALDVLAGAAQGPDRGRVRGEVTGGRGSLFGEDGPVTAAHVLEWRERQERRRAEQEASRRVDSVVAAVRGKKGA